MGIHSFCYTFYSRGGYKNCLIIIKNSLLSVNLLQKFQVLELVKSRKRNSTKVLKVLRQVTRRKTNNNVRNSEYGELKL